MVYFQIVGTHNTANEVFHAVHFESPAQPDSETRRPAITHNDEHGNDQAPDNNPDLVQQFDEFGIENDEPEVEPDVEPEV